MISRFASPYVLGTVLSLLLTAAPVLACSRILWNTNDLAVVVSRTMDWPESTEPVLTVFPRGMQRNGGKLGDTNIIPANPAKWTSRYGSLVTTVYGIGTIDGVNEKGLGIHALYLSSTNYGERDANLAGVHAGLWAQYMLDNAQTVEEALALQEKIQVVMAEANGHQATLHLAIEDAQGDSAIIEYIDGKPVVHHGKQYQVMTNDPTYDEQLALLGKLDFTNPSSETPLPGNVQPSDRFQRASYYLNLLPNPANEREAIAGVLAIARNVSVPFGAPYKDFGIYNTEYRTAINLADRRYFFELSTSPNVIWVDLSQLNLAEGADVLLLDPHNIELSGNVTNQFKKAEQTPF